MTGKCEEKAPWVIVSGGIHRLGGTDKANFALVEYLIERRIPVHAVTHEIDEELRVRSGLHVTIVPVVGGSRFISEKLLSLRGRQVAGQITSQHRDARVVVNGGNCIWGDINWVHRVHHAWSPATVDAPWTDRVKHAVATASAKK